MTSNNKNIDYYLNLPWTYRFQWDDKDNIYIASIAELKGCLSHGDTIIEAAENIKEALKQHIEVMLEDGDEIVEPPKPEDYKGKITIRTSPEIHYKLIKKAAVEGKSLNKMLDDILSKEVA